MSWPSWPSWPSLGLKSGQISRSPRWPCGGLGRIPATAPCCTWCSSGAPTHFFWGVVELVRVIGRNQSKFGGTTQFRGIYRFTVGNDRFIFSRLSINLGRRSGVCIRPSGSEKVVVTCNDTVLQRHTHITQSCEHCGVLTLGISGSTASSRTWSSSTCTCDPTCFHPCVSQTSWLNSRGRPKDGGILLAKDGGLKKRLQSTANENWDMSHHSGSIINVRLGGGWASLLGILCQPYLTLQDYLKIIRDQL